jgi:hypothetical protein
MPTKSYFYALGKFVHSYAMTESMIHIMFARLTELHPDVAMAIKGSMRVSDVMAIIKRLSVINQWPQHPREDLEAAFTQFNHISELRDRIIHRAAEPLAANEFKTSNVATMRANHGIRVGPTQRIDLRLQAA